MEGDRIRAKISRSDEVVLLFEEIGERRAVVASIRLRPDGELVVVWGVLGEAARTVSKTFEIQGKVEARTLAARFA